MHAAIRNLLAPVALLIVLVATRLATPLFAAEPLKTTGEVMAPGPDVEAAVKSEYDRVVRNGTRKAYQRFIRRHPDHPLADTARDTLAKGGAK